jgi:hypothetical protein
MFGGMILQAIETAQQTIGTQMASDALCAQLVTTMSSNVTANWMGPMGSDQLVMSAADPTPHQLSIADLQNGYYYVDQNGNTISRPAVMGDDYMPGSINISNLTTAEIQVAVLYIAGQESGDPGDKSWETKRQTWTSETSVMDNIKSMQTQPLTTVGQTQTNNLQQDQSMVSGSGQLSTGLAGLDDFSQLLSNIAA